MNVQHQQDARPMDGLASVIADLHGTIAFRERQAILQPDDDRNRGAIALARRLASEMRHLDRPLVRRLDTLHAGIAARPDVEQAVAGNWSAYRRDIGVRAFPVDAQEYVAALIGLVENLVPAVGEGVGISVQRC